MPTKFIVVFACGVALSANAVGTEVLPIVAVLVAVFQKVCVSGTKIHCAAGAPDRPTAIFSTFSASDALTRPSPLTSAAINSYGETAAWTPSMVALGLRPTASFSVFNASTEVIERPISVMARLALRA